MGMIRYSVIPVIHTTCGKVAMWYTGTESQRDMRSADIIYLDGTRPDYMSILPPCPHCGGKMYANSCFGTNLKRDFSCERVPFDVDENLDKVSPQVEPDQTLVQILLRPRRMALFGIGLVAVLFVIVWPYLTCN